MLVKDNGPPPMFSEKVLSLIFTLHLLLPVFRNGYNFGKMNNDIAKIAYLLTGFPSRYS